jgi:multisubunit Na+/H+ antiporter MnhE subunit
MDRRTKHTIILIVWLIAFFLIGSGVWSFQAGELMLIGFLMASLVVYILAAFLLRCPKCRMPVLLRPRKFLGMELFTWSILTPSKCRHCGEPLG